MPKAREKSKKSRAKTSSKKTVQSKETDESFTSEDSEVESVKKVSPKVNKQKDEMVEMIAIKFDIPDHKHPFNHLHGVASSIELTKIHDNTHREDVIIKLFFNKYPGFGYLFYFKININNFLDLKNLIFKLTKDARISFVHEENG
ncbi:unnamed protein product [Brachionus calyciflorus]|uniref:Uncharacterized protein n=1 Tax=Brachionus calyciflorus TaxID=104777 RepID=A0A814M9Q4_9BILA|nr:unnamed protein product [Brachionus calyciflorus]